MSGCPEHRRALADRASERPFHGPVGREREFQQRAQRPGLLGVRGGVRLDLPAGWFLSLRLDGRSYLLRAEERGEQKLASPLALSSDLMLGFEL